MPLYDRLMKVNIKSTVKLDNIGDWTENIGPLGEDGRVISVNARPFDFLVDSDDKAWGEDVLSLARSSAIPNTAK